MHNWANVNRFTAQNFIILHTTMKKPALGGLAKECVKPD